MNQTADCKPHLQWFKANLPVKPTGVALVIHGLNLNPIRMKGIIDQLGSLGIDSALLSLGGHFDINPADHSLSPSEARLDSFKKVSYSQWHQEILKAYEAVSSVAAKDHLPLYLVGYSLGGLMGCDLLVTRPEIHFQKMLFFAPALLPRGLTNPIFKLLFSFPGLVIPSRSPALYRANRGTPMAAYKSLADGVDNFHQYLNSKLNVPTLIIMDKRDELVSYRATLDLISINKLTDWKVQLINNKWNKINQGFRHLIIDSAAIGEQNWKFVAHKITEHLAEP